MECRASENELGSRELGSRGVEGLLGSRGRVQFAPPCSRHRLQSEARRHAAAMRWGRGQWHHTDRLCARHRVPQAVIQTPRPATKSEGKIQCFVAVVLAPSHPPHSPTCDHDAQQHVHALPHDHCNGQEHLQEQAQAVQASAVNVHKFGVMSTQQPELVRRRNCSALLRRCSRPAAAALLQSPLCQASSCQLICQLSCQLSRLGFHTPLTLYPKRPVKS